MWGSGGKVRDVGKWGEGEGCGEVGRGEVGVWWKVGVCGILGEGEGRCEEVREVRWGGGARK